MRLRSRLTYANVMSSIAVFVALGGGAYAVAVPRNSVGTSQLKRAAVTSSKIRPSAVTSSRVRDDSLRGADILESSLGTVPNASRAASAATADAVGGSVVRHFNWRSGFTVERTELLRIDDLVLNASCPLGQVDLDAVNTGGAGTLLGSIVDNGDSTDFLFEFDWRGAESDLDSGAPDGAGWFAYSRANNRVTTVHFAFTQRAGDPEQCLVTGTAVDGAPG